MAHVREARRRGTAITVVYRAILLFESIFLVLGSGSTQFDEFYFSVEPSNTVVSNGDAALLNCSAHHQGDSPQVQWIHNEVYLNFNGNSRRTLLSNGSLYISNVIHTAGDQPDAGVYQCVASVNELGTIVSKKVSLDIAYLGESFREEPHDLTVHIGDVAMFTCSIDGKPEPTIRWLKGGESLTKDSSSHYIVHTGGILEITNVTQSDFASYQCIAETVEWSRTSIFATLLQNDHLVSSSGTSPNFIMQPNDRVVVEGSTVTLYCGANGRDRGGRHPTITWLKDGVTITVNEEDGRFYIKGQGTLEITDVKEEDAGSYTCRATNQEDSIDADASLTVHVPPKFKKQPESVFAYENSDVEFECNVYGVPQPHIEWFKNGDIVIPSTYFQIVDGRNLRILGLVNSDGGIYQCLASNDVGFIQASAQLVITQQGEVLAPASDLPGPPEDLVARIVSTRFITLSWGMPVEIGTADILSYSVYWKEAGSNRERVMNTTRLEANVQHLKPGTNYRFRVQTYNRHGPSKTFAEITKETAPEIDVPGPPINLAAFTLSPSSIHVSWQPPQSGDGRVTKYMLYYYEAGAEAEQDIEVTSTEHELVGLQKFTEYTMRVVAYNSNGAGMSTDEVSSRTYSDVPKEPPVNVTLEVASSTSIIVHWEPPPPNKQNGIITGYKIRYKISSRSRDRDRSSETITTDGNRRAYALTDLERGTEYKIRILALNVNGTSPNTVWYTAETYAFDLDETSVPGRPTSLRVRPFSDSIAVSWTPPMEENIMVGGYVLGYGVGVPDTYQLDLPSKQRYHTIVNLMPSSQYVITLRAYNSAGHGEQIIETVFTREETTPEPMTPMTPPVGLKAVVLSPSTIVVTWSDNSLGRNQHVNDNRYYTIQYSAVGARKQRLINSTGLNAHIDDLKPDTEYEFSVMVTKGRRKSTWSMSVLNRTFEDAPSSAPRDLTPVAVEGKPTWITLNWQPPRHPNGQITGYLVYYTTDATQHDRDWVVEGVLGDQLSTTIRDLTPETTYYFKVQARNSKGYGPMSPTVIFRTPSLDGRGGGKIEMPNDFGLHLVPPRKGSRARNPGGAVQDPTSKEDDSNKGGIPPLVLWIVIGCVCGIALIAIIVVTVIVCKCRLSDADKKKRQGYKPANKGPSSSMVPGLTSVQQRPDLWIHDDLEMTNMDKSRPETMTVAPIPRENQDKPLDEIPGMDMDKRRNSFVRENMYEPHPDEDRYRRLIKPKPIMIPVEQPPPPREPIATAVPNGSILGSDRDTTPQRPLYPRTNYTGSNYPYTSTPRVNAGDLSQPSSDEYSSMSTLERRRGNKSDRNRRPSAGSKTGLSIFPMPTEGLTSISRPQSPGSPSTHNQHAPIPYEQLQHTSHSPLPPPMANIGEKSSNMAAGTPPAVPSKPNSGSKGLQHRPPHPLKSFTVPGPPGQSSPGTPNSKQSIVKPQQQITSPYKKPAPPVTTPVKPRSPLPVVTPKAPDVTMKNDDTTDSELPKSYSAEELSAEMANLEGLMKDLNAITQQEFEC